MHIAAGKGNADLVDLLLDKDSNVKDTCAIKDKVSDSRLLMWLHNFINFVQYVIGWLGSN